MPQSATSTSKTMPWDEQMTIRTFFPQLYDSLCSKLKELSALNGISGVLQWDEMVG